MKSNQPITTTFPLGLFCNATLSGPLPKPIEPKSALTRKDDNLAPDAPPTELENNGLNDDLYWDDELE